MAVLQCATHTCSYSVPPIYIRVCTCPSRGLHRATLCPPPLGQPSWREREGGEGGEREVEREVIAPVGEGGGGGGGAHCERSWGREGEEVSEGEGRQPRRSTAGRVGEGRTARVSRRLTLHIWRGARWRDGPRCARAHQGAPASAGAGPRSVGGGQRRPQRQGPRQTTPSPGKEAGRVMCTGERDQETALTWNNSPTAPSSPSPSSLSPSPSRPIRMCIR